VISLLLLGIADLIHHVVVEIFEIGPLFGAPAVLSRSRCVEITHLANYCPAPDWRRQCLRQLSSKMFFKLI
jgi:hypothetical protein